MSNTTETDYTKLRQVLSETKSASWESLVPRLEEWFNAHGIDFGKTRFHALPPEEGATVKKHCTAFLSLPGDDAFDIFFGDTPDELFDQITKHCASRVAAVPTNKDAAHMAVMNLPGNDLAYTNAIYINDAHLERGSLLFPEATTHVKINGSRIFPLIKHPLVQKGCIAMSSLQRESFDPQDGAFRVVSCAQRPKWRATDGVSARATAPRDRLHDVHLCESNIDELQGVWHRDRSR